MNNLMKIFVSRQKKIPLQYKSLGKVYDLSEILLFLNDKYFNGVLKRDDIFITWMKNTAHRRVSSITFGCYYPHLRLIKINRSLDNGDIPFYFLEFVVYHEMLHHFHPIKRDVRGRRRVHSKAFKEDELKYENFAQAKDFEKTFLKRDIFYVGT